MRSISSLLARARALGPRKTAWRAFQMLMREVVFRRDVLLVYAREGRSDGLAASQPTQSSWLEMEKLLQLREQQSRYFSDSRLSVFERRIDAGDRPYALFEGHQLVNLGWVRIADAVKAEPEVGSRISVPLGQPEPIIYDCWTPHEHRGHGHYPTALRDISGRLLAEHSHVWIYCRAQNNSSVRGIEKAGFTIQQRITRTRVLGVEWRKAELLQADSVGESPRSRMSDRA